MAQRREGTFLVLEDDTNCDTWLDEHQAFLRTMGRRSFTQVKTIEGNKFSTPFQDIWTNPEQTHQVHFVHDFITDTNYLRTIGKNNNDIVDKLLGWFPYYHYTEIAVAAEQEALESGDEDEQAQAIFDFAVGFYVYDSRYPSLFEKYLQLPSVKVRLATIRAIGFQLWDGCIPLLKKLISSDSNPAVRAYATETLRQIQQPEFDPDDLYSNPSNYPHSFERVTEKGLMILPQIKDDLQAWMKEQNYLVMDALVLYQYLEETYGEFKPDRELPNQATESESENTETQTNAEDNSPQNQPPTSTSTSEQSSSEELSESEQLKQQLKSDKKQLTNLRAQLKKAEERIENARRTNIFGRPQAGNDEAQRDKLIQEIKETQEKIAQNEALLRNKEE